MARVLRRLFTSSSDMGSIEEDEQGHGSSPRSDSGRVSPDKGREGQEVNNTAADISSARSEYYLPPPAAKVAFPALIARYCKDGNRWEGQGLSWLDSDEATCAALELDIHAVAMLVFVEWREFVSALPGCGAVLSRETSALWFAQVMSGTLFGVVIFASCLGGGLTGAYGRGMLVPASGMRDETGSSLIVSCAQAVHGK